jgi:hypothetical protein
MRLSFRPIMLTAPLALAATLWGGMPESRAQVAGTPAPRNYPGYYYSAGGYSGGYYFSPGYYPLPGTPAAAPARVSRLYQPRYVSRAPRRPVYIEDWSTGRTNYPIPLTKPWMQPLR